MMDCGLLLLFLLSLVLHVSVAAGPGFEVVRVMYCITLGFSFVRLPQLFMIHKDIGPKVIMIQKMLVDLVFFLVILLVFIFAYGVMRHTLIFPNSAMEWSLLTNVSLIPYWQVYGELFVDEQDGTTPHGSWLVYVLQGLYMLLTNVLLLNLLIAMFSFTFQKIQDNSEQVWRFHRYDLIYEFFDRPWGAPPVIILGHVWRFGRWVARRCGGKPLDTSDDFNRKFPGHEVSRQQALEKAGAENYLLRNLQLQNEHIDTKFATTSERLEKVLDDLEDIKESVQAKEELEASFYVPPAADVTDSATLRTRPSSATASTSGVAVDLQHRMSNLEDHLGSIKDLLEHLQPTQAPGSTAGDSRGRAGAPQAPGAAAEDRPTVARRPKSLVPQEYSDFPDPDDIM
ncbi:TRPM2 [Branchiostoma lanceolatum]|nr:TRPM2 [Branchiostoma lanceolatum]